jgi:hypothetical protein
MKTILKFHFRIILIAFPLDQTQIWAIVKVDVFAFTRLKTE